MFKNLFMSIAYFLAFIILSTIILTIFNYFNIIGSKGISILKFILPVLGIVTVSYILGKKSCKRGYLEGLKLGITIILLFIIIALITKTFSINALIYYLILLLSSILSSMIGINRKKVTD